jgi:hypothetical protein
MGGRLDFILVVDVVVVVWVGRKRWEREEVGRKEKTWCRLVLSPPASILPAAASRGWVRD